MAFAALATALSGCSSKTSVASTGYLAGETVISTFDQADRLEAPPLTGETVEGGTLDLTSLHGQVVVLNVWASWCGPCRAEIGDLMQAYGELDDAAFVGLNTNDDSLGAAAAFIRAKSIPYQSFYDDDGAMILAFNGFVTPNSLPSTVIIDDRGKIAALVSGQITASTLVGLVEDVQAET